jgi:DNA-directed RNA polymerase subunit RPC12/RpoP
MSPILYSGEVYKCQPCDTSLEVWEVIKGWQCPKCSCPINIKIGINGYFYSCLRLKPSQIKVGYSVILAKNCKHEIINIKKEGTTYRLALREYRVHNVNEDDFILVIFGSWSDD